MKLTSRGPSQLLVLLFQGIPLTGWLLSRYLLYKLFSTYHQWLIISLPTRQKSLGKVRLALPVTIGDHGQNRQNRLGSFIVLCWAPYSCKWLCLCRSFWVVTCTFRHQSRISCWKLMWNENVLEVERPQRHFSLWRRRGRGGRAGVLIWRVVVPCGESVWHLTATKCSSMNCISLAP